MERAVVMRTDRGNQDSASFPGLRWSALLIGLMLSAGCAWTSTVPSKFVQQAEPGVTLTTLTDHPEAYKGKVVILGGVIVEEKRADGRIWLWIRNRPLDEDHEPHRDATHIESESGHYWVMADLQGLPKDYRNWARLTVVGRVSNATVPRFEVPPVGRKGSEPILGALYMRGWGYGGRLDDAWETGQDPNYVLTNPVSELRQGSQGLDTN